MEIILKKDIEKLGKFGDVIEVSDGYARNYLFPRDLVWPAEGKYLEKIKQLEKSREARVIKEKNEAQELAREIDKISVTVKKKVGEHEKLFGSVTAMDINKKLEMAGVNIDKKDIELPDPIKKLGVYKVDINLHPEVTAKCKVWVVKAE